MPITIDGKLTYGLALDGVFHKDFTMRVPTMEEVETAIEDAGQDASSARVARYRWGQCLTRLGSIPPDKINAELLAAFLPKRLTPSFWRASLRMTLPLWKLRRTTS